MTKIVILFALVAAAIADPIPRLSPLNPTSRIVGGEETTIEQAPYQVSIQAFGVHVCGGSIISNSYILTGARCFIYPPGWYTVRSGSTLVNSGGIVSSINSIIIHEEYITGATGIPRNDIALVQLSSALTFDSTQSAIGLFASGQAAAVNSLAIITGWGTISEGGPSPDALHAVTVPIISKSDCNTVHSSWGGIPDGQICGGLAAGGRNSCQGDSGSPVTINGVLAGIVSWSMGCARPGLPGVYTEVATYRNWITANSGI